MQLLAELFVQSSRIFETTLNTRPIFQSNGHWNLRMQECLIVRNVCSWLKVRNNLKVISAGPRQLCFERLFDSCFTVTLAIVIEPDLLRVET